MAHARPPARPLQGYPDCDRQVAAIATELWQDIDGSTITMRRYGKGRVYQGVSLEHVLSEIGHPPAVTVSGADGLLCAAAGAGKLGVREDHSGIAFRQRRIEGGRIFYLGNGSHEGLRRGGVFPQLPLAHIIPLGGFDISVL